jgi:DNA-binding NarL/FixJ family response regulator
MRIVIADDHCILRQGLSRLLSSQPDFEVVAETGNGRAAVTLAESLRPDVVLMDVGLPELNGIEATRQIVTRSPGTRVLALSAYADHRLVTESLKAGASGYLLKEAAFEELTEAIQNVADHKVHLGRRVAPGLVDDYVRGLGEHARSVFDLLSPREREVLQLIAEGKSTKEVAYTLKVSAKTVETHRRQLMNKLEIYTVAELTRYALREGLVTLETRSPEPMH